ncbi:hypothetical protein DHX103_11620 [Planococcus sp. X10-3]|uniref:hypothetical protein n=1 Tax=Planococcus sp. X10-3 TaxID=3061240 RepID=UPI003BB0B269
MLVGIVLTVFGVLLAFGISYDLFVRKSFKSSKNTKSGIETVNHHGRVNSAAHHIDSKRVDTAARHIDNGRVDSSANQMSSQSTGF